MPHTFAIEGTRYNLLKLCGVVCTVGNSDLLES